MRLLIFCDFVIVYPVVYNFCLLCVAILTQVLLYNLVLCDDKLILSLENKALTVPLLYFKSKQHQQPGLGSLPCSVVQAETQSIGPCCGPPTTTHPWWLWARLPDSTNTQQCSRQGCSQVTQTDGGGGRSQQNVQMDIKVRPGITVWLPGLHCKMLNKQKKRPYVDKLDEPRLTVNFRHDRKILQQHSCSLWCLSFVFWLWLPRECK